MPTVSSNFAATFAGGERRRPADARERQRRRIGRRRRENDLEQRRQARAAHGLDGLDDLLERHVLVRVRVERHLAHSLEQLPERRIAGEIAAEHEQVQEEPDQRLELRAAPAGARRPDDEFGCRVQRDEQHEERRQHRHEGRRAGALAEALDRRGDVRAEARTCTMSPSKVCTAGRGRSVGSCETAGAPASWPRPVRRAALEHRLRRATAAATRRSRRTGRRAARAATRRLPQRGVQLARSRRRAATSTSRPSDVVRRQQQHLRLVADDRSRRARTSGPASRSNGRSNSSAARIAHGGVALARRERRANPRSRASGAALRRSSWTGAPSTIGKRVRSAS